MRVSTNTYRRSHITQHNVVVLMLINSGNWQSVRTSWQEVTSQRTQYKYNYAIERTKKTSSALRDAFLCPRKFPNNDAESLLFTQNVRNEFSRHVRNEFSRHKINYFLLPNLCGKATMASLTNGNSCLDTNNDHS